jgi:hypothetical protein
MSAQLGTVLPSEPSADWGLVPVTTLPRTRALAWANNILYVSQGYTVKQGSCHSETIEWQTIARFDPPVWRRLTSRSRLPHRLVRDGFHALVALASGHLIGTVPGAIVNRSPDSTEFLPTHAITRGTRPLHLTATPNGTIFWGEYFDNPHRNEVHIYASADNGGSWHIAHTFPKGTIRHVHNIVYDQWENCLWILTGDYGSECQILRASCDLTHVEVVRAGNQQARAVALVPAADGLYFSSDTPLEANHIYRLGRDGALSKLSMLTSSSIYGCRVGEHVFFSTMVEPSRVNSDQHVRIYGTGDGTAWKSLLAWQKDRWSMRFFQYGNAILPDGLNSTAYFAVSSIAVQGADLATMIFRIT